VSAEGAAPDYGARLRARLAAEHERAFWVHEIEAQELEAPEGVDPLLYAAHVTGFDNWPDVIRLARTAHPGAIELLCRRVERGL
jgi:hypothetical protein